MSIFYNMATGIMTILVAVMVAFVVIEFKTADPIQDANMPKQYGFPESQGLTWGSGLTVGIGIKETPQKGNK